MFVCPAHRTVSDLTRTQSLAYEVAPFNVKLTIIQPSYEISVLTNQISAAPAMPQYMPPLHPAPLSRATLGRLLARIEGIKPPSEDPSVNGDGTAGSDTEGEGEEVPSLCRQVNVPL